MSLIRSAFLFVLLAGHSAQAQCDRWQQRIRCTMEVELDVRTHRFSGTQELEYVNNGPDTLHYLFFHLYFNAFRPESEMDVRSRTIADPDGRIGARIQSLLPEEQGELRVTSMSQAGRPATLTHLGTILRADLAKPILPGKSTRIALAFDGQVPVQIRRSGRNNAEGVAYTMTQWFPKVAAFDHAGWHADPYVGREFYGEWGDYDVTITLDSAYTVAATGTLQNAERIGHGYPTTKPVKRPAGDKLSWRFVAENVHDFAWAADDAYVHTTIQVPDGPLLHFFRIPDTESAAAWSEFPSYMVRSFQYMNRTFGRYPWPQFSFVQGGDGGMEYPMLTMITGKRRLGSLVGVSVHESVHSWYYGVLASNESRFPWMDEGFTEYASSMVMQDLFPREEDPHASAFLGYAALAGSEAHEPMSLHADHYTTNGAYGATAYSKGELFLHQLGYVIGDRTLMDGLLRYYNTCKFKHPEPIDVQRVMEKESGLELDWYFSEWINTTREVDYAISAVLGRNDSIEVTLTRKGEMLMPIDLLVLDRAGNTTMVHIPLSLMLGAKPTESEGFPFRSLSPWQWTDPSYSLVPPLAMDMVAAVVIDPTHRLADLHPEDNVVELPEGGQGFVRP